MLLQGNLVKPFSVHFFSCSRQETSFFLSTLSLKLWRVERPHGVIPFPAFSFFFFLPFSHFRFTDVDACVSPSPLSPKQIDCYDCILPFGFTVFNDSLHPFRQGLSFFFSLLIRAMGWLIIPLGWIPSTGDFFVDPFSPTRSLYLFFASPICWGPGLLSLPPFSRGLGGFVFLGFGRRWFSSNDESSPPFG